jgi:dual specificity tyrosine-phosphorylation-regulated kinase 2/3/4
MSIETTIEQRNIARVTGLFAVKNRVFSKIIQKQIEVVSNLDYHLDNHVLHSRIQNYSGIKVREDIRAVLKKMLDLDPEKRISPMQVLT